MDKLIDKYYNTNIQTDKLIINDICNNVFNKNKKMLVFGLGYDSELWYNSTNKNTYFIENYDEYININKNINSSNIIKYIYNTKVKTSFELTDNEIHQYSIPEILIKLAPFDIIYIDGPVGANNETPGRLLPIFWSKEYLSKPDTLIYIDDSRRPLEKYCIDKYFKNNEKIEFNVRGGCMKIKI
jgi:hypothetical protein